MAKNLLDKLTTLIKANLQDLTPSFPVPKGNLQAEIAHLKRQITSAEADEHAMQAEIAAIEAEVARWDEAADQAVQARQDVQARQAIEKMETAKQRYQMARSQLEQHRRSLYDLMLQVNQLETLLKTETSQLVYEEPHLSSEPVSDAIRRAREAVQGEAESEIVRVTLDEEIQAEIDSDKVEADLANRRSRLAKPD